MYKFVRSAGVGMLVASTATFAVDGVLEINHTCATQIGCFAGDTVGYPVTIDGLSGKSYRLTGDLTIPDVGTIGIEIQAPDISLDLNGFSITGLDCVNAISNCTPTTGTGDGIFADTNFGNISLSNGSVIGMGNHGIELRGSSNQVVSIRAKWNGGHGISAGSYSLVSNNNAFENRLIGVRSSSGATLIANTASGNGAHGIFIASGVTASNNTSYANTGNGIFSANGSNIVDNTVFGNGGHGIETLFGCFVQKNLIKDNTGFGLVTTFHTSYQNNIFSNNTAGFVSGSGVNMGDNLCDGSRCASELP